MTDKERREWIERICLILRDTKTVSKVKFLTSILRQALDKKPVPTPAQIQVVGPMYKAWQKRQIAKIIGE